MAEIQIGIEGESAPAAAEALLEIPEISGSYEVLTQREGTLAAVANIIGIVGGAVALAEQIANGIKNGINLICTVTSCR